MIFAFHKPPCPKCKATTTLARITPGRSGFDIRTFECRRCDHIFQRVVAFADPMKSTQTAGWFRGELRAPT
jgi:transposase-like protein